MNSRVSKGIKINPKKRKRKTKVNRFSEQFLEAAKQQGRTAFLNGVLFEANPLLTPEGREVWNMGWMEAQEETERRKDNG